MSIKFFDMFASIGGFRSGLETLDGFECVGYCEIDRYARQAYEAMYNTGGEIYFDNARKIISEQLPDFDFITGGFPCQSFSIAGARKGFNDTRGTLFFKIARIAAVKIPKYLFLENVLGLLNHNQGRTFATILNTLNTGSPKSIKLFGERRCSIAYSFLIACGRKRVSTACTDEGYDVCWQILNCKNFGVPQSRNRVYIVGYLRGKCAGEVLSFTQTSKKTLIQRKSGGQGRRIYSSQGLSCTLTSGSGGFGGHSGLYLIENIKECVLPIKSKTELGYQIAYPGDSIDIAFLEINSRRGRVGSQIAHTLTTVPTQSVFCLLKHDENRAGHSQLMRDVKLIEKNKLPNTENCVHFIDMNPDPKLTEIARCITARQDSGVSNHKAEHSGFFEENRNIFCNDEKFAVAFVESNGEVHIGRIRKLTPRECWRLQGFTDEQFDKAKETGLSDSRLYKMAGNAVTVNVISEIGKIIRKVNSKNK